MEQSMEYYYDENLEDYLEAETQVVEWMTQLQENFPNIHTHDLQSCVLKGCGMRTAYQEKGVAIAKVKNGTLYVHKDESPLLTRFNLAYGLSELINEKREEADRHVMRNVLNGALAIQLPLWKVRETLIEQEDLTTRQEQTAYLEKAFHIEEVVASTQLDRFYQAKNEPNNHKPIGAKTSTNNIENS